MERPAFLRLIAQYFRSHRIVGILGPRQCGKTTLVRDYIAARRGGRLHHHDRRGDGDAGPVHYFDLEDPEHLARLTDPKLALESRKLTHLYHQEPRSSGNSVRFRRFSHVTD